MRIFSLILKFCHPMPSAEVLFDAYVIDRKNELIAKGIREGLSSAEESLLAGYQRRQLGMPAVVRATVESSFASALKASRSFAGEITPFLK